MTHPEARRGEDHARALVVVQSPIGPLLLEGDADSISRLHLANNAASPSAPSDGRPPGVLRDAVAQLDEYFAGARSEFSLPLAPMGTPFQLEVWRTLGTIGYGSTITYGELAKRVGRTGASRAVGQANGANPLPIFFPCHRVVAAGGRIGGYGGGLEAKRWLLALEGHRA